MKKFLILLILGISLVFAAGCHEHSYASEWSSDANGHWHAASCHAEEKKDEGAHAWALDGTTDENGNPVYRCSVCGYLHQHVYDAEKWEYNGREHWHPVSCGHAEAPLYPEEHDFDDETGVCTLCGCDEKTAAGYEVAFAYYVVDENGNPVVDADTGAYSEIGVTYTSVEADGSLAVDTVNGGIFYEGDKISFTVKKSVFCYYTDAAEEPLVEVITRSEDGNGTREALYPNENGVYTVTVHGDTVVSVANVATSPRTIQGSGTQEDPFTINSVVDWLYFAMYVNDGNSLHYNVGYWRLDADLDFEGESVYVVGDGFSSANSIFCGNFDGNGHTISNMVLDNAVAASVGEGYSNYLGVFGVMTGYVGVDSVIANLTVENVTINATAGKDDIVSVGGVLGYGVGANIRNCVVRNVQINVVADDVYMSYAGGIVGYLQSGMTEDGILFYSSVAYSVAENLTIKGTGMLYSAGGIAGRVVSYNDQVTSFILNSYSSGNISDAVRAGGIAGDLQRYGSIQNCYSTANVSAYATYKSAVDDQFAGTAYDDRYAYAGGVVGYVENDTVVEGCFFEGDVYATALAGTSFGKTGRILAGYSAEKFADYFAKEVVLDNAAADAEITSDYLKNQLHWSEVDWNFESDYPTVNQEEAAHVFTITVNVEGEDAHVLTIDSQYIPLSYWYIIYGNGRENGVLAPYYQEGTDRTYGYYFDGALTKPVPVGYVPMRDITLYAAYADTAEIAGVYYLSGGGVSAEIVIDTDGTYTYQEGAILLTGRYRYDGTVVTFENSFFSRVADTATPTQRANYYTFWATVGENGDLSVFDCAERYLVTEDMEAQNPSFVTMARFFPETDPLVLVAAKNLSFTGGYYYSDGEAKHVFEFSVDYTGVYTKYVGTSAVTDTFRLTARENGDFVISLDENGTQFLVKLQGGKPHTMQDNRGDEFSLSMIDAFVGSWEKEATSHKRYTFDGMGNWTYEHFVYLVDGTLFNYVKETVTEDYGTYVIDGETLLLTRREGEREISVVATVENGVISVTEDGQPVAVEYTGLNGYRGVWYTANNKIVRYTLTLEGLNAAGVGKASLDGFGTEPLNLLYTAVSEDTLYLYIEDVVYAVLQYSARTGLFEGMFYSAATGSTTTPQTLYLYDDFYGSWVSDIEGIAEIKFNGFGAYDTKDSSGNTLAVKGSATIGGTSVPYVVDRATGEAEFTFEGVTYRLTYNEYADEITVVYGANTAAIAKADEYANVVFLGEGTEYRFDGRGRFAEGGTVLMDGVAGTYKIQSNGDVLLQFEGKEDQTLTPVLSEGAVVGYTLNGNALSVDNAFSGTWAIPEENRSISVGEIAYFPQMGRTAEVSGSFGGEAVTMYFNGSDTLTFEHGGRKYVLKNALGGKASALILTETITLNGEESVNEYVVVRQDDFFGTWKREDNERYTLTFDGCGDSNYLSSGKVADKKNNTNYKRTYKIANGVLSIYAADGSLYATFVECEKDADGNYVDVSGAYYNGERYYRLHIA